jgi:hypothetical protein
MASSAPTRPIWPATAGDAVSLAAYALGAVALAGEAAVHVQQYFELFHEVSWIGPLFLANAVACVVTIAGLAYLPTRQLAALAGIVISVVALASLVISYGQGLFGWQEVGFRTAIVLVLIAEVGAVICLATALGMTPAIVRRVRRPVARAGPSEGPGAS